MFGELGGKILGATVGTEAIEQRPPLLCTAAYSCYEPAVASWAAGATNPAVQGRLAHLPRSAPLAGTGTTSDGMAVSWHPL